MSGRLMLFAGLKEVFAPPTRLSASKWVESFIKLPPGKNETKPGRVRFEERPYLREPLDRINDPKAVDVGFVAPTRDGKTFLIRMAWAYSIAGDPSPSILYDQNENKGRTLSIKELQPLVEYNAILKKRKPSNRHHYTNTLMMFLGAPFVIFGASTAGQAAGDTAKRIFGNEIDKWGEATDKEAGLVDLVRHRTESFEDERFHFFSSTPSLESGAIWVIYKKGDCRVWRTICPDCGEAHELIWKNVRWDPDARMDNGKWNLEQVGKTARYYCPDCQSAWDDRMRLLAVQHKDAHWHPTNPLPTPGYFTYHINGLYGPLKKNNCGSLTIDFLGSRDTGLFADRQDFWNSRMGMPWTDDPSEISNEKFAAREIDCLRGEKPSDMSGDLLLIGFDVQTYGMPWVVEICDWTGRYHTVDHGVAAGWNDLEAIQLQYTKRFGVKSYVVGDMNFEERRTETLEAIYRRRHLGWLAAEGFEFTKDTIKMERANVYMGGKLQASEVYVAKLVLSTYVFKVELEKAISGELDVWTTYRLPPLVATESEVRDQKDFYAQLLCERRVKRKRQLVGKPLWEFVARNKNNHAWDCKVYIRAAFYYFQKSRAYAQKRKSGGGQSTAEVDR